MIISIFLIEDNLSKEEIFYGKIQSHTVHNIL